MLRSLARMKADNRRLWTLLALPAGAGQEGPKMESPLTRARHEVIGDDDLLVHEWRVTQLTRLGIPWLLAQSAAGHVDWHQVAKLVQRGCPPQLALHIVR